MNTKTLKFHNEMTEKIEFGLERRILLTQPVQSADFQDRQVGAFSQIGFLGGDFHCNFPDMYSKIISKCPKLHIPIWCSAFPQMHTLDVYIQCTMGEDVVIHDSPTVHCKVPKLAL